MKSYAGLEVSLEETAICIVDETGAMTRESVCLSDPDALARFRRPDWRWSGPGSRRAR